MKKIVFLATIIGLGVWLFWVPTVTSEADLGDGKTVVLRGQPLFGWHSDWSRQLVISDGWSSETVKLFEDTGWWRGSALYRDAEGGYLLDDGIDYVVFALCPPRFIDPPSRQGNPGAASEPAPEAGCHPGPLEAEAPASRYHDQGEGLRFLGIFVETHPGLAFRSWRDVEEPMPDSIDAGG
ncbi:hypothetical protein [Stagnihabitans tardus]|uniref:Uncharacterized protein n=1 Tax=Stagnihabitans tardus TaxID=2699202 RepID=A0AAE5BXE9_9RHOB|nr:hypothetical protein [Stagnihabitans tardus]NBZ89268.1 hypothetical protein [Stagnihabitans tardus]